MVFASLFKLSPWVFERNVTHLLLSTEKSLVDDLNWLKTSSPIPLDVLLPLLGGICWSIVYVLISIRSARSRTQIFIPILALSMNIVWECIYSFFIAVPEEQEIIDHVWFGLDLIIIFFTWWNFLTINSKLPAPQKQTTLQVFWYLIRNLLIGVFFNLVFIGLVPESSAFYGAFMINVVMSYVFLYGGGQSPNLPIAVFKMLGTALTSVYAYLYLVQTKLMILTYVLIFILDCAYIIQVINAPAPPKAKSS